MLVRREALRRRRRARGAARRADRRLRPRPAMKRQGPIWLGLTEDVLSLRALSAFADFGRMVVALRLRPIALFAAAPRRRARRHGARPIWPRRSSPCSLTGAARAAGRARLGADGARASRRRCASIGARSLCGFALPAVARAYIAFTVRVRARVLARARRLLEGPLPGADAGDGQRMTTATEALSGKAHRDENFPSPRGSSSARAPRGRSSPSIASRAPPTTSPTIRLSPPDEKLALLDRLDEALCGRGPGDPEAEPLRLRWPSAA